jgi:hypothetical protein
MTTKDKFQLKVQLKHFYRIEHGLMVDVFRI